MKSTSMICLLASLIAFPLAVTAKDNKAPSELKQQAVSQGYAMRIQLNTASLAQLQALKGIGQAKARAIIEYRDNNDGFKSVDELTKVKGIGPKVLEDNKDLLSL
ncbi:MAG: helix-hairpin-helix domain-containing protein [Shewanella sp.]|nr:helix-hairpin-helix domain-containing protein [Shewanella sp.]MCF1429791.1 helix-hairpin-helix domain-containing protein [Shewanella sp.]MCF1439325.1 helix-hairpin-helix domain-containing protein [Shewanella sp.]MCF1456610.1 helix-hairpin-helix domain-containing protein [Shewanella sp.]